MVPCPPPFNSRERNYMFSTISKVMAVAGVAGSLLFVAPGAMASTSLECKGLQTCLPVTQPSAPSVSLPSGTNCQCSPTVVYASKTVTTRVPVTTYKTYTVPVTTYVNKTTTVQVAYYKVTNPDYSCGCETSTPQYVYVAKDTGLCYVSPGGELYNQGYTRQPFRTTVGVLHVSGGNLVP